MWERATCPPWASAFSASRRAGAKSVISKTGPAIGGDQGKPSPSSAEADVLSAGRKAWSSNARSGAGPAAFGAAAVLNIDAASGGP